MCGIVGFVDYRRRFSAATLSSMRRVLAHRGPDDEGSYTDADGAVALGHQRLAILDLSSRGRQPMSTPDGRLTIVFNGEIYNYLELRDDLQGYGIEFQTSSDTEVLLRAYETWGVGALDRLLGMFAFAIWDRQDQSLVLARDRVGKKPLIYFSDGAALAFASELKALLAFPQCTARLDPEGVQLYLALGYIPAPFSIFRNVRKLQPGHYLRFRSGRLEIHRYWFPEQANVCSPGPPGARIEELRGIFREAVRIRLRSDVPIALFLSGGIDSAAVAAECCEQGHKVRAFTATFDYDSIDLPYATAVAQHLGLEQETIHLDGSGIGDEIHRIIWYYDEPFADTSNIPSYYIAKAAQEFKVVLNGDGGDEAFGGYAHYEYVGPKQKLNSVAARIGFKDGRSGDRWQVYFQSKSLFRRRSRVALLKGRAGSDCAVTRFIDEDPFLRACPPCGALHRALWADRHVYLAHDLLFKMDIALMAHSIEGRSPFLDHRLLEWAQSLPAEELVAGSQKKVLLRRAFRKRLPAHVLDRTKHGFGSPIVSWLAGPWNELCNEYLPTPLLERAPQELTLARFRATGRRAGALQSWTSDAMQLWTLLMFSLWARRWKADW